MRSLVLILMIALLPLRMWAAEGMAVRMAAHPSVAMEASMDESAMDGMPDDCPMRAAAAQKDSHPDKPATASACLACQLCAAVGLQADFEAPAARAARLSASPVAARFDSADPARENKPPIS